jgi:hypothetical protein
MRRTVFSCTAIVVLWSLTGPMAVELAVSKQMGISAPLIAKDKLARPRDKGLRELPDGLAHQITEINNNIANLGPYKAAALRFRALSLATYQWAELTRSQVDFGDTAAPGMVAALAEARS